VFKNKTRREHQFDVVYGSTARLHEDVLSFSNDLAVAVLNGLNGTALIVDAVRRGESEIYLAHVLGRVFEIRPPEPSRLRCRLRVATIWNDTMYDMLTTSSQDHLSVESKSKLTEVEVSRASDVDIVLSMAYRRQESLVKHFGWSQGFHTFATMRVNCSDAFSGLSTNADLTAVDVAVSEKSKVAPFASVSSAASSRESVFLRRDHVVLSELLSGKQSSKKKRTRFCDFMSDVIVGAAVHVCAHITSRAASRVDVLGVLELTGVGEDILVGKRGGGGGGGTDRRKRRPPKWLDSVLSKDDDDDDDDDDDERETKKPASIRRGTFWGTYNSDEVNDDDRERRSESLRSLRKKRKSTRQPIRVEEVSMDEGRRRHRRAASRRSVFRRSTPNRPMRRNSRAFLP
jgi:hypothetical protein